MDSPSRDRMEAWLRYNDDLGLGPFYRDRAMNILQTPIIQAEQFSSAQDSAPTVLQSRAANSAAGAGPMTATPASLMPVSTTPRKLPPTVLPVIGGSTLFDERIEGDTLQRIRDDIGANCTRCKLHKGRTKIVFGVGNPKAELVFVGEGPDEMKTSRANHLWAALGNC